MSKTLSKGLVIRADNWKETGIYSGAGTNKMLKRAAAVLLTLFAAYLTWGQAGGTQIGGAVISPLMQRTYVRAYATGSLIFTTENPALGPVSIDAEIKPFIVNDWSYDTKYVATHARDCSKWFKSQTLNYDLVPGERKQIKLDYKIPGGCHGSYWAMFRFIPHPDRNLKANPIIYEIPIIFVVGHDVKPEVKISSPIMELAAKGRTSSSFTASTPIENTGDGFTPVSIYGTLKNKVSGVVVAQTHIDDRNLFPRTKRKLGFYIPNLADGAYHLTMRPILGTRALPPVSTDFDVRHGTVSATTESETLTQTMVAIEPTSLPLSLPKGSVRREMVHLVNHSNKAKEVQLTSQSVQQLSNGAIGFENGKLPQGVTLTLPVDPLLVNAGQSLTVPITVTVPETAKGDIWFAVKAAEIGKKNQIDEMLIGNVAVQGTIKPEITVNDFNLVKDGDKVLSVKFKVHNSGNVALTPIPSAAMLADGVKLVQRLGVPTIGDGGLLPGAVIDNEVMLPPTQVDGSYIVEISYQYSKDGYGKLRVPVEISTIASELHAVKVSTDKGKRKKHG